MSLRDIADLTIPHSWCNMRINNLIVDGSTISSLGLTTKGDLLTRTTSANTRLGVGTNGQILIADSSQTTGLGWGNTVSDLGLTGNVTSNLNPDGNLTRNLGTDDFLQMWNQINVGTVSSHSNNLVIQTSLAGNIVLSPVSEIKLPTIGSNKLLITNASDGIAGDFYQNESISFTLPKSSILFPGTSDWKFSRTGNQINAYIKTLTGTASSGSPLSITTAGTLDSDYVPTTDLYFPVIIQDTTIQTSPGLLKIGLDGSITFYKDLNQGSFTNGVTVGIPYDQCVSYQIT